MMWQFIRSNMGTQLCLKYNIFYDEFACYAGKFRLKHLLLMLKKIKNHLNDTIGKEVIEWAEIVQ